MRILHLGDDFVALRPCGLTLYSEALMDAQACLGHDVSYVFSGRHYPYLERPRLKRWRRGDVRMHELVGSTIHGHWEKGTRRPLDDLEDHAGEVAVAAAMRDSRAEILHIHELARLPSSVIDLARDMGVPVVMTLHDYKPVCASVRLLDADARVCLRSDVGTDCARNCAGAPDGRAHLIEHTLRYERRRVRRAFPFLDGADLRPLVEATGPIGRVIRPVPSESVPLDPVEAEPGPPPGDYQRRRDVNVQRLASCDRLIAPSQRVAEIYALLGVPADRMCVQRLTLPHLAALRPAADAHTSDPLHFVALGACSHPSKGSRLLTEAVELLARTAREGSFRLTVFGFVELAVVDRLDQLPMVELAGAYSPADLKRALADADIGILPSTWEEAHGFVGIEMLASGLPVIGSAIGGIPEYVVPGQTGWLNASVGPAELAEIMASAIADPAEVVRLQRSVRERRAEIVRPMSEHVSEVLALYDDVASAPTRSVHAAAIASPAAFEAGS